MAYEIRKFAKLLPRILCVELARRDKTALYNLQNYCHHIKLSGVKPLDLHLKIYEKRVSLVKKEIRSEHFKYARVNAYSLLCYALGKKTLDGLNYSLLKSIYLSRLVAHLEARKQRVRGKPWIDIHGKEVHHINGNPLDNRTENLIPVSRELHLKIHKQSRVLPNREQILKMIKEKEE